MYHEVEDNDLEARANIINSMTPGQTITEQHDRRQHHERRKRGVGGLAHKITTSGMPRRHIYRNRLAITSGTPGPRPRLRVRGLSQTNGMINAGSGHRLPVRRGGARWCQWYGFGRHGAVVLHGDGDNLHHVQLQRRIHAVAGGPHRREAHSCPGRSGSSGPRASSTTWTSLSTTPASTRCRTTSMTGRTLWTRSYGSGVYYTGLVQLEHQQRSAGGQR